MPTLPRIGASWQWQGEAGALFTRGGGARLRRVAGGFEGRAWLDAGASAPFDLLNGLVTLLSHRLGGAVLHAGSVELDGRAVAFLGPSGAGKTTACLHVSGAELFSIDRLVVLPAGEAREEAGLEQPKWLAHPLAGGTRPAADRATAPPRWLPLAGALRVLQSRSETLILAVSPAARVAALRESTFQTGLGTAPERELLATLDDLARQVPIGRLRLRLGASLEPLLRRWLENPREERT